MEAKLILLFCVLAFCAVLAEEEQEEPSSNTEKPPNLLGKIVTAPITGLDALLGGLGSLLKGLLKNVQTLLTNLVDALIKLLEDADITVDGLSETLKCIIVQPLKLLECFEN